MMNPETHCSHGKLYVGEECAECERVSILDDLNHIKRRIDLIERRLAMPIREGHPLWKENS